VVKKKHSKTAVKKMGDLDMFMLCGLRANVERPSVAAGESSWALDE
jgi:hypothetical protein